MDNNERVFGSQRPPAYGEQNHAENTGESKQETEPLVSEQPTRPQRRRTFEIPKVRLPKMSKDDKKDNNIMRLYGKSGLVVLARTAISIAGVGITGAMFSRKVRGSPAVAAAFSMAVGCINIPMCCLRPWPRKPQNYKPNMLYLIMSVLMASLWTAAVAVTFYMVSKGDHWVFNQTYPQKVAARGYTYNSNSKPMTAEQAAHTVWPHLIGTGALDSVALLLEFGHIYYNARICTRKFSEVEISKGLKGISETLKK
ncbi:hypothetical protein K4F52_007044 [Lecanicillium sp. MT-2017a]|nr:hypothetical protein K4F52_007044 [Lecanicillium sp. MT-2017a]